MAVTEGVQPGVAGLEVRETALPGMLVLEPRRYRDERGFFSETFSSARLRSLGVDLDFIQDNHSVSAAPWTLRGFHFQAPPHAQAKLVRVVRGAILDAVLDLRAGSPTFGRWATVEISEARWNQVLVPQGFAHAFLTLEPDTHVLYKVTAPYVPEAEGGVRWDDPDLDVEWPRRHDIVMSHRDRALPRLRELDTPFVYETQPEAP